MKPPRAAEKKIKNDQRSASKRVSTATEKVPRLISDRLRLWSCAGFVEENSAPFQGRTSWTMFFFNPEKFGLLGFFFGCPKKGGVLRTKKNSFKC